MAYGTDKVTCIYQSFADVLDILNKYHEIEICQNNLSRTQI